MDDGAQTKELDASVQPEKVTFPVSLTLRNHGRIAIKEPVTGAFLSAGGHANVQVHDQEQLDRLLKSIESNTGAPGRNSLAISGLPVHANEGDTP